VCALEKFFDVCDKCGSRELDFVFFDLKLGGTETWIKDIPGFRCRDCGEILASSGVVETLDEVILTQTGSSTFPILRYQKKVTKALGLERDLNERLLHAWSFINSDGRELWALMGFRTFGDLRSLVAI
jgi:hypothetical protein